MSKAFTKEDDGQGDDEALDFADTEERQEAGDESDASQIRFNGKNYVTPKGAQALKDELHQLLSVERPKLVETIAWAASNGDRSENADYIYGKRRLREIDRRLHFLQKRLDAAVIVDPALQKSDRVLFGATVTIRDEDDNQKRYQIVGIDETDVKQGRVSWISPIGKVLLQTGVGDFVILKTPKGEEELEVIKIEYLAIE